MRKSKIRPTTTSKGLTEKDLALWHAVTERDEALPGRTRLLAETVRLDPNPLTEVTGHEKERPIAPNTEVGVVGASRIKVGAGLDRRTAQKLKRGQIPIEARLDLHGMTQAEAQIALNEAVGHSRALGNRCLLVITGKGSTRNQAGVLKKMVPRWLEAPVNQEHVLAVQTARPQHGGAGAVYVLLRKQR